MTDGPYWTGPRPGGPARPYPPQGGYAAPWPPPDAEPVYVPQPPPAALQPPGHGFGPYAPTGPYAQYAPYGQVEQPPVSAPIFGWLLILAALLAVLGAVLPWASTFGLDVPGTDGGGRVVIACAVVVVVCGLVIGLGRGQLWASASALAVGMLIGLIGLLNVAALGNLVIGANLPPLAPVTVGSGLWVTIASALLITGLSAIAVVTRRPPTGG